jgi:hypothetical protein
MGLHQNGSCQSNQPLQSHRDWNACQCAALGHSLHKPLLDCEGIFYMCGQDSIVRSEEFCLLYSLPITDVCTNVRVHHSCVIRLLMCNYKVKQLYVILVHFYHHFIATQERQRPWWVEKAISRL